MGSLAQPLRKLSSSRAPAATPAQSLRQQQKQLQQDGTNSGHHVLLLLLRQTYGREFTL
jgi:hypothetical protein